MSDPGASTATPAPTPLRSRLSRFILHVFFREIVVEGRQRLPPGGPAVFAPNHPNSLLDPLFMSFFSPPFKLRFIAKQPLFRMPLIGSILKRLKAIPVVRRFEAEGPVDYTPFFEACANALAEGAALTIFPEGRSLPQPRLAPLKTGPARIVVLAAERGLDVPIVPVALNYEEPWRFRSAVHVSVGTAVRARELPSGMTEREAVRALTESVSERLDRLLFQTDSYQERELAQTLERLYAGHKGLLDDGSWGGRIRRLRTFERGYRKLREREPQALEQLRREVEGWSRIQGRRDVGPLGPAAVAGRVLRELLGLPVFVAAAVVNTIPWQGSRVLARRLATDAAGEASFKVVLGALLYPLWWLGLGVALGLPLGWLAGAVFVLMQPLLAWLGVLQLDWYERTGGSLGVLRAWLARRGRSGRDLERRAAAIVARVDALAQQLDASRG